MARVEEDPPPRLCHTCMGDLAADEVKTCRRCKGDCWPGDTRLRRVGFRIVSRPKHGQPVWERHGVEFLEGEARQLTETWLKPKAVKP